MIIPWLRGFLLPKYAPVTWLLFVSNVLIFMFFSLNEQGDSKDFSDYFSDRDTIKVQGYLFASFIDRNHKEYSPLQRGFAKKALAGHEQALKALGALATRDAIFSRVVSTEQFKGDQIAIERWRTKFTRFIASQKEKPGYRYGMNIESSSFFKSLSYQFMHSDYMHLMSNMFCLLIFGCLLETVIGGSLFVFTYLLTGVVAASAFSYFTGLSDAPLIGASGAINGLIGFFAVMFWKRKVTFLFVPLPKKGFQGVIDLGYFWFAGFIKIPAWVFVLIWIATDLAALMASVPEFGGVAYTAHLGGFAAGAAIAGLFLFWRKSSTQSVLGDKALL